MPLAKAPIHQKVLAEKRGHHHAHAVVHEACGEQLTHACVDEGIARLAFLPLFEADIIVPPRHLVVLRSKGIGHAVRKGVHDGLVEIPPNQFGQPFFAVLEPHFGGLSNADGAKPQVHTDAGGPWLGWHIAHVRIGLQCGRCNVRFGCGNAASSEAHDFERRRLRSSPCKKGIEVRL